jgi:hypothetical protein
MHRPLLLAGLLLASPALAQEPVAIPLTVEVVDAQGLPVVTAVIRHQAERDLHPVNNRTGVWTADRLYLHSGLEEPFVKGATVELEISAPGFVTSHVVYMMRKRKNRLVVTLEPMPALMSGEEDEDPVIQFGRDKPIDPGSGGPAH